jgi:hypothetical protein
MQLIPTPSLWPDRDLRAASPSYFSTIKPMSTTAIPSSSRSGTPQGRPPPPVPEQGSPTSPCTSSRTGEVLDRHHRRHERRSPKLHSCVPPARSPPPPLACLGWSHSAEFTILPDKFLHHAIPSCHCSFHRAHSVQCSMQPFPADHRCSHRC